MPIDYSNLPIDAEQAFLQLEESFREECEVALEEANNEQERNIAYTDYMAHILAAIEELGLEAKFKQGLPKLEDVDYYTYQNFSKDVKHYRTRLEVRFGRRIQGYSVLFDSTTKSKLRHLLDQIKTIFDKLEVSDDKKEALFKKLNALLEEIDRDRTRLDAYGDFAIEVATISGEVVQRSRILELLDGVARTIWGAQKEERKRLSPPSAPKQIENKTEKTLDDEIPF